MVKESAASLHHFHKHGSLPRTLPARELQGPKHRKMGTNHKWYQSTESPSGHILKGKAKGSESFNGKEPNRRKFEMILCKGDFQKSNISHKSARRIQNKLLLSDKNHILIEEEAESSSLSSAISIDQPVYIPGNGELVLLNLLDRDEF